MKKIITFLSLFVFAMCLGLAQEATQQQTLPYQFSLYGGIHHVFEYGSSSDSRPGWHNFPITPSHNPIDFGAAFAYFFKDTMALELDFRYVLSAKVTMTNPNNQDEIEYSTDPHLALTANFLYLLSKGDLKPYIMVGAGFDNHFFKEETYTSKLGYSVEFAKPKRTADGVLQAGAGVQYFFGPKSGLRADVRYIMIFADPNTISVLNGIVGFFTRF
jgi:outer membrane protein W